MKNKQMSNFKISKELKDEVLNFLNSYMGYKEVLDILNDPEKMILTEKEINSVIVLLGSFRLGEVFQIVDRFRSETEEITEDAPDPQS